MQRSDLETELESAILKHSAHVQQQQLLKAQNTNNILVLQWAICTVNQSLRALEGWGAGQWFWKHKILQVKLNTYKCVYYQKQSILLQAKLTVSKAQNIIACAQTKLRQATVETFWQKTIICPVCQLYATKRRSVIPSS